MKKGQDNGQTGKKGGIIRKVGKKSPQNAVLKVKRLSNKLKKVNKIFQFSEDFGASAGEGIWNSG